jgi:uncharacterized protein (TIGR03083 family)
VRDVARHVGGLHHVIVGVIEGRPTANFSLFKALEQPAVDDPALGPWLRDGAATLVECLRATPSDTECWSFGPGQNVGFWKRRSAHEAFVHGWDAARAAGTPTPTIDAEVAADGIDEYLDLFASMMRGGANAPGAGETAHVHCTDAAGEWLITFPKPGERVLTREHAKGDVAFRGPAEALVLYFWGRLPADEAGVEVIGDTALADRWFELVPSV